MQNLLKIKRLGNQSKEGEFCVFGSNWYQKFGHTLCKHSKILTIQQGYPWGVSSIAKLRTTSIGISSVSIYRVYLGEWPIKSLLTGQVDVVDVDVGRGFPVDYGQGFSRQVNKAFPTWGKDKVC